jgi:hypothetical protein
MFHSREELQNMTTETLRDFIVDFQGAANVRQMKNVLPETREYNLERKSDCISLYRQLYKEHKEYEKIKEIAMSMSYVVDMDYNKNNTGEWVLTDYHDYLEDAQQLLQENPDKYRNIDEIINTLQPLGLSSASDKDIAHRMQVDIMHTG